MHSLVEDCRNSWKSKVVLQSHVIPPSFPWISIFSPYKTHSVGVLMLNTYFLPRNTCSFGFVVFCISCNPIWDGHYCLTIAYNCKVCFKLLLKLIIVYWCDWGAYTFTRSTSNVLHNIWVCCCCPNIPGLLHVNALNIVVLSSFQGLNSNVWDNEDIWPYVRKTLVAGFISYCLQDIWQHETARTADWGEERKKERIYIENMIIKSLEASLENGNVDLCFCFPYFILLAFCWIYCHSSHIFKPHM